MDKFTTAANVYIPDDFLDSDPEWPENAPDTEAKKRKTLTEYFEVIDKADDSGNLSRCESKKRRIETEKNSEPGPSSGVQSYDSQDAPSQSTSDTTSTCDNDVVFSTSAILDGKYFKVVHFDKKKKYAEAACQLCLPACKIIKGSLQTTTNFIKHIKRVHANEYSGYEKYKAEKQKRKQKMGAVYVKASQDTKMRQRTLTSTGPNKSAIISQAEFNRRMVHFVINTVSAVSIIDHPSFKAMFDGFNVKVMGRKSLMNKIQDMFREHQEDLKLQICEQKFLCSTADIWSSKQRSFMGVTLHWLDDNLKRVSVAIACQRFPGVHNYKAIAEILDAIYSKYGIKNEQIIATVTDNGSNFVKAFKEFGLTDNLSASCSNEQSLVPVHYEEDNEYNSDPESGEEVTMVDFPYCDTATKSDSDSTIILSKHFRCASHTLNLIATSDCMKAISANLVVRTKHMFAIDKCRKLWKRAKRPGTAEIIMGVLGHTLSCPGDTRWNSYYDSISRIINEDTKPKLLTLHQKLGLPNFKDNELQYLQDYCQIMKPLATALDILQGDLNTYFGFLLPTLTSLANKWKRMKVDFQGARYFSANLILNECINALYSRFSTVFKLTWEDAILAAVTIPKFKFCWYNSLKSENPTVSMESLKQMVISAIVAVFKDDCSTMDSDDREKEEDSEYSGFFDFSDDDDVLQGQKGKEQDKKRRAIELELLQYIEDKRTNLSILHEYPHLKKLFLRYNTCIPSSASVERLFSFATMVNEPRRHALTDENFEKLVVLKANKIGL